MFLLTTAVNFPLSIQKGGDMSKTRIFLAWFLVLCLIEIALTQIRGIGHSTSSRSVIKNFEEQSPKIGAKLPELKLFDENGITFNTNSLRGNYTVLVFGCLT